MSSPPSMPHAFSEESLSPSSVKDGQQSICNLHTGGGDANPMYSFLDQLNRVNGGCKSRDNGDLRQSLPAMETNYLDLFISHDKTEQSSYVEAVLDHHRGISRPIDTKKFDNFDDQMIEKQGNRMRSFVIKSGTEGIHALLDEDITDYPSDQIYQEVIQKRADPQPGGPIFSSKVGRIIPPEGAPVLSAQMLVENQDVLGRPTNDLIVEVGPHRLYRDDFNGLKPHQWLEDQVIDLYFELIKRRSQQNPELYPQLYTFTSTFYALLGSAKGLDKVRESSDKDNILNYDLLLFPVCRNYHWRLIVADVKKRQIHSFNSLTLPDLQIRKNIERFLVAEEERLTENVGKPWTHVEEEVPLQGNCYDCGMFLVQFANYVSRRQPFNFTQANMLYFRQLLINECANGRLLY